MKEYLQCFVLQPLKKLVSKITGRRNDDNDHFSSPYIIL